MIRQIAFKIYVWLRGKLGIKQEHYQRPEVLKSMTIRKRTSCGKVYLTVSFDQFNQPKEVFFQTGSEGCQANQAALGRLTSVCLRYHVPLNELVEQLLKCHCVHSMKKLGKLENEKDKDHEHKTEYTKSCADAIANILDKYNK